MEMVYHVLFFFFFFFLISGLLNQILEVWKKAKRVEQDQLTQAHVFLLSWTKSEKGLGSLMVYKRAILQPISPIITFFLFNCVLQGAPEAALHRV